MEEVETWNPPDPRDEFVYILRKPDGTIEQSVTICIPCGLEVPFAYEMLGRNWTLTVVEAREFARELLSLGYHLDRRVSRRVSLRPCRNDTPEPPRHNRVSTTRRKEPEGPLRRTTRR